MSAHTTDERPAWNDAGAGTSERAPEAWHRLYVEVDARDGTVWEIQRLDAGARYRILRNLDEAGSRRAGWDSIRAQFCRLAAPMCPDLDEPQVAAKELSFIVTHGSQRCEVGRAVVSDETEAVSYAAAVFEMNRKGRADDAFRRRLHGGYPGWTPQSAATVSTTLHVAIINDDSGWEVLTGTTRREMFYAVWWDYVSDRLYSRDHDDAPIDSLADSGAYEEAVEAWFMAVADTDPGSAGLETTTVSVPPAAAGPCILGVLYAEDVGDDEEEAGPWYVFAGRTEGEMYRAVWREFLLAHRRAAEICTDASRELACAGRFREAVEIALDGLAVGVIVEFNADGSSRT